MTHRGAKPVKNSLRQENTRSAVSLPARRRDAAFPARARRCSLRCSQGNAGNYCDGLDWGWRGIFLFGNDIYGNLQRGFQCQFNTSTLSQIGRRSTFNEQINISSTARVVNPRAEQYHAGIAIGLFAYGGQDCADLIRCESQTRVVSYRRYPMVLYYILCIIGYPSQTCVQHPPYLCHDGSDGRSEATLYRKPAGPREHKDAFREVRPMDRRRGQETRTPCLGNGNEAEFFQNSSRQNQYLPQLVT